MEQIPPLAWVAIILIAVIFVVINLGLVSILRNRSQFDELAKRLASRPPSRTVQTLEKLKEVARDPFKEQRVQVEELSRLVSTLKEPSAAETPPNENDSAP